MGDIVILAALDTNRDPMKRMHVYERSPIAYTSLEEAIRAAKHHYWKYISTDENTVPRFRVYESSDPDGTMYALVEVSEERGDMVFVALYKAIAGKYQWAEARGSVPQGIDAQDPFPKPPGFPVPASLPPEGFSGQT